MDTEDHICRLCRRESGHLESLQGYREGLPLSVLVMIICPIKIERSEATNLPKFVCGECLEVVLSAYKLRDESLQSDRFFRECVVSASLSDEDEIVMTIKQEEPSLSFAEPLPVVQHKQMKKLQNEPTRHQKSPKKVVGKDEEFPYKVDCYKSGNKSAAWDYFGRLVHLNNDVVEEEEGFLYCKVCVDEKKSIKTRYKGERISTGMIFTHLKTAHGIGKCDEYEEPTRSTVLSRAPAPVIQGLTFPCSEIDCDEVFKLKICLEIHIGLEHTGIADAEPSNTDYRVEKSIADGRKSMAWSYFGPLLNSDSEVIDDAHNYCRLCVNDGILTKYLKSCSTTTLLHHVHDQHLKAKKRKRRFATDLEISAATSTKIVKN